MVVVRGIVMSRGRKREPPSGLGTNVDKWESWEWAQEGAVCDVVCVCVCRQEHTCGD